MVQHTAARPASSSLGYTFGFIPMKMSSFSLSLLMRLRQMKPLMAAWIRLAASSCVRGTPMRDRLSSIWRCFLSMDTIRARSRAWRPAWRTWVNILAHDKHAALPCAFPHIVWPLRQVAELSAFWCCHNMHLKDVLHMSFYQLLGIEPGLAAPACPALHTQLRPHLSHSSE